MTTQVNVTENNQHDTLVPVHSLLLQQYGEAMKKFEHLPAVTQGLQEAVIRITVTLDRINENLDKAQKKEACSFIHAALETLRAEQLTQVRSDIQDNIEKLNEHTGKFKDINEELAETRGAMKFLKWGIPIAITISPGIAIMVIHIYGK